MARAGYKPVIEYCGGTELGGGYFSGSLLQPQAPSTFSTPTVGHQPVILVARPDGSEAPSPHGDVQRAPGAAGGATLRSRPPMEHPACLQLVVPHLLPAPQPSAHPSTHPPIHFHPAAVSGELALAAPALGMSQRLLNKDHAEAYYAGMPPVPGARWAPERPAEDAPRGWAGRRPGGQPESLATRC